MFPRRVNRFVALMGATFLILVGLASMPTPHQVSTQSELFQPLTIQEVSAARSKPRSRPQQRQERNQQAGPGASESQNATPPTSGLGQSGGTGGASADPTKKPGQQAPASSGQPNTPAPAGLGQSGGSGGSSPDPNKKPGQQAPASSGQQNATPPSGLGQSGGTGGGSSDPNKKPGQQAPASSGQQNPVPPTSGLGQSGGTGGNTSSPPKTVTREVVRQQYSTPITGERVTTTERTASGQSARFRPSSKVDENLDVTINGTSYVIPQGTTINIRTYPRWNPTYWGYRSYYFEGPTGYVLVDSSRIYPGWVNWVGLLVTAIILVGLVIYLTNPRNNSD